MQKRLDGDNVATFTFYNVHTVESLASKQLIFSLNMQIHFANRFTSVETAAVAQWARAFAPQNSIGGSVTGPRR